MQNTNIIWKTIPQYSRYKVSNTGLVKSLYPCDYHRGDYILKPRRKAQHPYPMYMVVGDDGKRRCVYLHCLVVRAFYGEKPFPTAVIRHLDGNPLNNSPENLIWGTVKENVLDTIKHGKFCFPKRRDNCIGRKYVSQWRNLLYLGFTKKSISKIYGVHHTLVGKWCSSLYK